MNCSSSRLKTLPVGLLGVLMTMALVLLLKVPGQFLFIEMPVGLVEGDEPRRGPAEDGVRPVVFVEGLEDDDFLPGVDDGQEGRDHALRGPAADRDLLLRVHLHAVVAGELFGDRLAERREFPR